MQRLLRKLETAKKYVPSGRSPRQGSNRFGAIYFGSTSPAMAEALVALEAKAST